MILVLNTGSSSLKFALQDPAEPVSGWCGVIEKMNSDQATMVLRKKSDQRKIALGHVDYQGALEIIQREMNSSATPLPVAVAHRVVHGGEDFTGPARLSNSVLERIEALSELAPLHNGPAVQVIRSAGKLFPALPHIAIFDSAFHHTLPSSAFLYAIPFRYYQDHRVRRYGFHGISHQYLAGQTAKLLKKPLEQLQLVTVHLGNGCSATAIRDGRSLDNTMGLTPDEGMMMGTRSGDVDPTLHAFLMEKENLDIHQITETLNRRSGLLGVSEISSDIRELEEAATAQDNDRASLALALFCYRAAKGVLQMLAALDRLDALVFAGGIGEHSSSVRAKIVDHLTLAGLKLDPEKNNRHGQESDGMVGSADSVPCLVIPTNEEWEMAQQAAALLASP